MWQNWRPRWSLSAASCVKADSEDLVGSPYDADNMCSWTKLMAEMTLRAFCKN